MNQNERLITNFYTAFAKGDVATMSKCYHNNVVFEDPAFGKIHGQEVTAMWQMLIERSKGNLKIDFDNVIAENDSGQAIWVATYNFSKSGRRVVNTIHANFKFENDLIITHHDHFDIWKWSIQALGLKGFLMGWTTFMQNKVRENARLSLKKYMEEKK
jgi:ketosteroid isomerase-like protein